MKKEEQIEKLRFLESLKKLNSVELSKHSKEDIKMFIRYVLNRNSYCDMLCMLDDGEDIQKILNDNYSFEMSGYDKSDIIKFGQETCVEYNQKILNKFAYLGIYNYTNYLYLDFHKGCVYLYLNYWYGEIDKIFEFHVYTTSNIIFEIFELTIFSKYGERRHSN